MSRELLKIPRHRPSWLFRAKLLSDVLFRTRGGIIALFVAFLTIFSGRSWNLASTLRPADNASQESISTATSTAQAVTLHTASVESVSTSLTLTGTVVPQNLVNITSPLEGLPIAEMKVESGDRVSTDQILAVLDSRVLQTQLRQAEANLAQAQTDLQQQRAALTQAQVLQQAAVVDANRYGSLYEAGAISQEQLGNRQIQALTTRQQVEVVDANLESARANIDSKAAEIDRIQALIAQAVVTAPVSGTIAERFATIGDTASANSPLYSLIENHQLILELRPEQAQLADIDVGMPVTISAADSEKPLSLTGNIEDIEPMLNAQSRQATVKVSLPESSNRLRSGMFLQAKITTGTRRSIVVSADAVITQPDGRAIVFTLHDLADNDIGKVKANYVEVANHSVGLPAQSDQADYAEILSGLTTGDQVIVSGASYLQSDDFVKVVSEPISVESSPDR